MSATKAVPKPALMGNGITAKAFATTNLTGKNSTSANPTAPCPGCSKPSKPVPTPKMM